MRMFLFVLLIGVVGACKNNEASTASQKDTATVAAVPLAKDSAGRVEQLNFIDGCVENAKLTLGEEKAFAFCKCMYAQVQAKYPGLDSSALAKLDSATVAKLAAACR